MGMNIVTGMTGIAHITSDDDRIRNSAYWGRGKWVFNVGNQLEAEKINNNTVRIKSGMAINQGTQMGIEADDYEDCVIDNGLSGVNRNDLIVIRYQKQEDTELESASLVVIKGTSGATATDPAYTTGNILDGGDLIDDMPLYRVRIESLSIVGIDALFDVQNIDSANLNAMLSELNAKMDKNNPTGIGSLSINRKSNTTVGATSATLNSENIASGDDSVAVGYNNTASGDQAFAEGIGTVASAENSHAGGNHTIANQQDMAVFGEYNSPQTGDLFEIGNGTISARTNALRVTKTGEVIDGAGNKISDVANKVDKINGKSLSTNDYTTAEKNKLAGIASGAEVNVQPDWNQNDSSADDYIKNKPPAPDITGKMDKNNPTGTGSLSINRRENVSIGTNSSTLGVNCSASGAGSHAQGNGTTASGNYSFAEGNQTTASGHNSHAGGVGTQALNNMTAFGLYNSPQSGDLFEIGGGSSDSQRRNLFSVNPDKILCNTETELGRSLSMQRKAGTTTGNHSATFGHYGTASGEYSIAEGNETVASSYNAHAMGVHTTASGPNSIAAGDGTVANDENMVAFGTFNKPQTGDLFEIGNGKDENARSNAFRVKNNGDIVAAGDIIGSSAVSVGRTSGYTVGNKSIAMGDGNRATGDYSVAIGEGNRATANYAHTIGVNNKSEGLGSFSAGNSNTSSGYCSAAIGENNTASGDESIALGYQSIATENYSVAIGHGAKSDKTDLIAMGKYNKPQTDDLFEVGNGSSNTRSNAFRVTSDGNAIDGYGNSTKQMGEDIFIIKNKLATVFTFRVDGTESDPSEMITYKHDAVGMSPAYMDYTNNQFISNGWDDVWFLKNLKPMIMNLDGSVDTFLSPTNTSLDIDGNAVNHSAKLDGTKQYMIQYPEIYTRITPSYDGHSADISVSDVKVNDDFKCWSYYNKDGVLVPHFYYPMFKGSIVNNKLVSIPQMTGAGGICKNKTAFEERNLAQANGAGWDTVLASDRQLVNILLMLIGKSTNTQAVFGNGIITGDDTAFNAYTTGELLDKGLFYGFNDDTHSVKVLGIENYWSTQWDRCLGDILLNGDRKFKACYGYEDGSTVADFNFTGEGYPNSGVTQFSASGNYISQMKYNEKGMFASAATGSGSTYYADGMWIDNGITAVAFFGGSSRNGLFCGASAVDLSDAAGLVWWGVGASPSYR